MAIAEVTGVEDDQVQMQDIFEFERTGISNRQKVLGRFKGNGVQPLVLDRLKPYQDTVEVHEKNVEALKRELGNLSR